MTTVTNGGAFRTAHGLGAGLHSEAKLRMEATRKRKGLVAGQQEAQAVSDDRSTEMNVKKGEV